MLTSDLYKPVLLQPAEEGGDRLTIMSGYISASMMSRHLLGVARNKRFVDQLPRSVSIRLVYGMYMEEGTTEIEHERILALVEQLSPRLDVFYLEKPAPVHSKVYVWESGCVPFQAFIGSANYSQAAFFNVRREVLMSCEPSIAERYASLILDEATDCRSITSLKIKQTPRPNEVGTYEGYASASTALPYVDLPLFSARNPDEPAFGLRWNVRPDGSPRVSKSGTRKDLDALYFNIPAYVSRSRFFPTREGVFLARTDDGEVMECVTISSKDKRTPDEIGGITSRPDNQVLGRYIRNRIREHLGPSSVDRYIGIPTLKAYGRLFVRVYKFSEDVYEIDFAPGTPIY